MIYIHNINYNEQVNLIGTAHFTRRSISEAHEAINSLKPRDIAIELDWRRYRQLNRACIGCPRSSSCKGLCEFTSAADALGNEDANIWLIDMSEEEMRQRIRRALDYFGRPRTGGVIHQFPDEDPIKLWEMGYKEKVIDYSERQMEVLRRISPSIPLVLIDERNALMASRLAWIASKNLDEGKNSKTLALVGAAHVKGIKELLSDPMLTKESLRRLNLSFSEPTLIRRVAVQEA